MDCKDRIHNILEQLFPICEAWIQDKEGQTFFVDPIDGVEISAHYGATHMAAALILYGKLNNIVETYSKGIKLLLSILDRWDQSICLPAFHYDFNNFALCLIEDAIKEEDIKLAEKIRQVVLHTADSNHNTINWLPMRWYVNKKRFEWTKDNKYLHVCNSCKYTIEKATNADGGIEDRMPKGISFNLQYDVATVGVLQFLRINGEEYDLSKEVAFLLNAIAPDGDINYQGRGTNQVFAWSLWIYLLASSSREDSLSLALDYLEPKVLGMFRRRNLMLNEWDGEEKYLWWDYHYCSVYSAHFLLWMVLSLFDYNKKKITEAECVDNHETGLRIYRTNEAFISYFSGRKEYLSEKGPMINLIWTKKDGIITKVSLGPWQGAFGVKYFNSLVMYNFIGLLQVHTLSIPLRLRDVLNKIGIKFKTVIKPAFTPANIRITPNEIQISINLSRDSDCFLNIPILKTSNIGISVTVDGQKVSIHRTAIIKNQYDNMYIWQTKPMKGKEWVLSIPINK